MGIEALPAGLVERLQQPAAFPRDPSAADGIEFIQTHISHVFLTRLWVYKFRKAVELPFVSFATRAERDEDCRLEVSLNRRLAPDVYRGIAPLLQGPEGPVLGEPGEGFDPDALEHCVVMRRLPAGCDAASLVGAGQLGPAHVESVARRIARFHDANPLRAVLSEPLWFERNWHPFRDVLALLADAGTGAGLEPARIAAFGERAHERALALAARFEERREQGRAVHGHGDLHLQHVWFEGDAEPIIVDCVEFRPDLREIDAASEVAYLAMDLAYRSCADLGEHFLRRYAWLRDDFGLYPVVDYFMAYRAAVRGAVAAVAAGEADLSDVQRAAAAQSARAHFELAAQMLDGPAASPVMVAMTGSVGTGKSTAARAAAAEIGAVVIGSDRTRKSLAGMSPLERGGPGLYQDDWSRRVYDGLLERAAHVLASGRSVVLDATYARRSDREAVSGWAAERRLPLLWVETHCEPAVTRERLEERARRGRSESDAGPERLEPSLAAYQAPDFLGAGSLIRIATAEAGWVAALRKALARWSPSLHLRGPDAGSA